MNAHALEWCRGLWRFYLEYTQTAAHAATAASFAIFGLLVFVDPLFAVIAIGSYVVPPVVLYALDVDPRRDRGTERTESSRHENRRPRPDDARGDSRTETLQTGIGAKTGDRNGADSDSDTDSDDGDTDSADGDTDSDSDTDSDDGDTDTDSDS